MRRIVVGLIVVCLLMIWPVGKVEADSSKDYVDSEQAEFFVARVAFEVVTKITADKSVWPIYGTDKTWYVDDYSAGYEIRVSPVYSSRWSQNNFVPDPYYATQEDVEEISEYFIPQLVSEDVGESYELFSGNIPYGGLVSESGVEGWKDMFANSVRPYSSPGGLYGTDRGFLEGLLGEDVEEDMRAEAFFGETTSFYGGMAEVEAFGAENAVWFTHLTVTSDVDFYDEDDNYYGSDHVVFDVPVSLPGPIELNGVSKRLVQTFQVGIYFPLPKGLNVSNPYYTDVGVVGTQITGSDWHQTVRHEPVSTLEAAVRTTDYVVKTHIAPYVTWGYLKPGSDYDGRPPVPKGKQYPDGGEPDPNVAIFGGLVESTSIKLLYLCQPGGGDNTGRLVPGFEACVGLIAIMAIVIWRRRQRDEN